MIFSPPPYVQDFKFLLMMHRIFHIIHAPQARCITRILEVALGCFLALISPASLDMLHIFHFNTSTHIYL